MGDFVFDKRGMGDFVFDKRHGSKRGMGDFVFDKRHGSKRGMGDFVFDKRGMGDFVFDKKHYGSKRRDKKGMGDFVFDKRVMSIGGDGPEVEWMKRALVKRSPTKRQFSYFIDKKRNGPLKRKRSADKRQFSYWFDKRDANKRGMSIGDDDVGIEWSKRSRSKRESAPQLVGPSIPWSV